MYGCFVTVAFDVSQYLHAVQGIVNIWVDDPPVSGPELRKCFKSLQTVNDDLYHWLDRLLRLMAAGSAKGTIHSHVLSNTLA